MAAKTTALRNKGRMWCGHVVEKCQYDEKTTCFFVVKQGRKGTKQRMHIQMHDFGQSRNVFITNCCLLYCFSYISAGVSSVSSVSTVWAVEGGRASLPCDIAPEDPLEQVTNTL